MTAVTTRLLWGHDRYGHVQRESRRRWRWAVTQGRNARRALVTGQAKSEDSAWTAATEAAAGTHLYERQPW
jgi:hypothetical protein